MEEQKMISVIIPVYNVEKYLDECLDSVINQTYRHIEIICVDDGSTDDSLRICEKYAAVDSRIRVVHQENGGLSSARNKGLRFAKGEYVYFLDSDDKIVPQALQELVEVARNDELDILLFDGSAFFESEELAGKFGYYNDNLRRTKEYSETVSGQRMLADMCKNGDYRSPVMRQFFRRGFLTENDLQFYEGILHEDELFSFTAMLKAKRVAHRAKAYYLRRLRANSIMTSPKTHANFKGYFISFCEMFRLVQKTELSEEAAPWIWNYMIVIRRLSYDVYSQLPEEEKKGIGWTDDLFTCSLFKMSEYQEWMDAKRERDRLLEELNWAEEHPILGSVYRLGKRGVKWLDHRKWGKPGAFILRKLRGGIRCLKQNGLRYTVKHTLNKIKTRLTGSRI